MRITIDVPSHVEAEDLLDWVIDEVMWQLELLLEEREEPNA